MKVFFQIGTNDINDNFRQLVKIYQYIISTIRDANYNFLII